MTDEEKYRKILAKVDLFWSLVERGGADACWPWRGACDKDGYGFLNIKPTLVKAHRGVWILTHGMITSEEHVLHRCDNPPCCNPGHLFLGNNDINVADMVAKGRQSKGEKNSLAVKTAHDALKKRDPDRHQRIYGDPHRGIKNFNAKLSDDDVRVILAFEGPAKEIATRFGVAITAIYKIRKGESWRHVTSNVIDPERYPRQCSAMPGAKNPSAKLCDDDVRLIRQSSGTQKEIAAKFGIAQTIVSRIRRRELWKHVA